MIRWFESKDIDDVMSVWLSANTEAHAFIDSEYWRENFEIVKEMIPKAEVYVSEDSGMINGFVGITENYIAGIFVDKYARSRGIGSSLLSFAKRNRKKLELNVYKRNSRAVNFYKKNGFKIASEGVDTQTSEAEYIMTWKDSSL